MRSRCPTRRHALALLVMACTCGVANLASAQTLLAGKPVRIVVNFPAGGPTDTIARVVAEKMATSLKTAVIVDNKAGAGGNIGAAEVARSEPDGHTILVGIDTTFTINPAIYKSMSSAPDALKPLMIMGSSGLLIGINPSVGVRTVSELITKAKRENLTFSSAGNGSPGHFAAEIFNEFTGGKITHVPYKGNAPAVLAILSGEVQGGILATPGMVQHVRAGKITPLAVTSAKRSLVLPDVPPVSETGLESLEFNVLQVAMLPTATPAPIVETLRKAMSDALERPDVKAKLAQLDLTSEMQAGAVAQERLDTARARYARIVKATGMKAE